MLLYYFSGGGIVPKNSLFSRILATFSLLAEYFYSRKNIDDFRAISEALTLGNVRCVPLLSPPVPHRTAANATSFQIFFLFFLFFFPKSAISLNKSMRFYQ